MRPRSRTAAPALALAAALAACGGGTGDATPGGEAAGSVRAAAVVDSIRPIEEELRMFRATLPHQPTRLDGGAASVRGLASAFAAAVNQRDHDALAGLAVDRAEFAWFYYPHTRYTAPPYELAPALVWFRLTNRSSRGLARVLATFEHRELSLDPDGTSCGTPEPLGDGRLHDCAVRVLDADGGWVAVRLFGTILERDGRFKILSFANELGG